MKTLEKNDQNEPMVGRSLEWLELESQPKYKADCCLQLKTVFWRSLLTAIREPQISQIRIIQAIVILTENLRE